MSKRIILSPHLDDAVLDFWHVLVSPDAVVLTIFSGIPPEGTTTLWDRICGEADSHKMMQKRKLENDKAITISGHTNSQLFLDLLDNQYRSKGDRPSVDELADAIEKLVPGNATFFAPLALSRVYRHPDHLLTRQVGLELYKRGRQVSFSPDYPYMASPHRPTEASLNRLQTLAEKVLGLKLSVEISNLGVDQLKKRHQALKLYTSQYTPLNIETFGAISRLVRRNYEIVLSPA